MAASRDRRQFREQLPHLGRGLEVVAAALEAEALLVERFETEMSVIGPMGFSSYFLVVADICQYARDDGQPVIHQLQETRRYIRRVPA
ncbi:hypothetical protein [Streptomyces cyslabdanicus]|uniref:hypothetical protein n=1 Tax=Streptomyces cyslabdanicus TaxID=1470456 RepID=UPI004043E6AF